MNERKIRPVLLCLGVLLWAGLMGHSYLSLWEENPPTYRMAENQGELIMYIEGEVQNPGPYAFQNGDTYEELIALAGGLTETANRSSFNPTSPCIDGETLYIEKVKTVKTSSTKKSTPKVSQKTTPKATEVPVVFPLDLNSASHYELCALPGIGETLANRIIDYRNTNGAFTSVEDLLSVSGIGQKKLDGVRDKVYVK